MRIVRILVAASVVFAIGLVPLVARGSGLELREQGAAALARVDAVTAKFDHPSVVYYNPAGIGFLEGLQLSAGVTLIFPDFTGSDPNGHYEDFESENKILAVPHIYATYRINEMFAVGLSFNVPFGLGIKWPDDFAGRHISQDSAMEIMLINPTVSIQPIEGLSIGAGIQLMPATVRIERAFGFPTNGGAIVEGGVEMGGTAFGVGGNLGIMYRPLDWLFLGFFYRSRIELTFEGGAHFDVPSGMVDRSVFHDQDVEAGATMPDYITIGLGFQVHPAVYLEADVDVVFWSSIDELSIKFPDDKSGLLSEPVREDWKDIVTLRFCVEGVPLDNGVHNVTLRGGVGYDFSPAPDHTLSPLLPDSDRAFGAIGIGYTYEPWRLTFDVAYLLSYFIPREVDGNDCSGGYCNTFAASYKTIIHLLGVDLTWRVI